MSSSECCFAARGVPLLPELILSHLPLGDVQHCHVLHRPQRQLPPPRHLLPQLGADAVRGKHCKMFLHGNSTRTMQCNAINDCFSDKTKTIVNSSSGGTGSTGSTSSTGSTGSTGSSSSDSISGRSSESSNEEGLHLQKELDVVTDSCEIFCGRHAIENTLVLVIWNLQHQYEHTLRTHKRKARYLKAKRLWQQQLLLVLLCRGRTVTSALNSSSSSVDTNSAM